MSTKTICLNMIVKNESHVILETLENILKNVPITYWVISDTGSSDDTKELIREFFYKKEIEGELIENEWVDFGTNRTIALSAAYSKTDYLFIFDADDRFHGNFIMPILIADKYSFRMNHGNYYRPLLINNRKKWKFTGVLHEYLEKDEMFVENTETIHGDYYIQSGRTGARSKDPEKYIKDAIILKNAYEEAFIKNDPIMNRYVFYCANSYRDAGKYQESIDWYKKTLTHKGWIQEKYVSCLRIYECYEKLNQKEHGFYYLIKSFEYDKERFECFHKLISHYCIERMDSIAYSFYELIQKQIEKYCCISNTSNTSKLFLDSSIGDFFLPYIMIIVSHRINKLEIGLKMYEIIFTKKYNAPEWHLKNLVFNIKFFKALFDDKTIKLLEEYKLSCQLFKKIYEETN